MIEKRTIFVGENIKGENNSSEQLTLRMYVITISDLPFFKKANYMPNYKTIFSNTVERKLFKGEFEMDYPKNFPPTISSKHFKTRCSLLIGKLRLGGRILYPRKDLRLKVLPSYNIEQGNSETLQTNKTAYEPGEEIEVTFPKEEISIGVSINEWYKEGVEEINDEYILSEGDYNEDLGKWIIKLPPDPTSLKDSFLFYPFSFEFASDKINFGIRAYVVLEKKDETIRKEISIIPKKPMFVQKEK